ncbi:MAG: hypothetical protein WC606_05625 [Candidatus Absconditabacterales bacterium]
MVKNKKKSPGRPKKEFVSKKPKAKIKSGPGRPRKDQEHHMAANQVPPAIAGFVEKSVDDSKKKDLIILLLFLLSFILFVVSLYFTFMRDKKASDLTQSEIAEMANIETGNIEYTPQGTLHTGSIQTAQKNTTEQQMIIDFYQAVNTIDTVTIHTMADAHLKESNVFKTYYSKNWLSKFSEIILAPKIVVTNIQEKQTNSTNPNIKNFSYTLEYALANTQQKFTEERSTVLIKKGDERKIGKLLCETKGCSTMPFFNPDKYKNN